jgi:hypothetical protein
MKKEKKIWVDSYIYPERYEVSNLGMVRNKLTKNILKISQKKTGYGEINLKYKGESLTVRAHRLIYFSFFPNTPKELSIHHKDKVKMNNILSNLEPIDKKYHSSQHAQERIMAGTFYKFPKGANNIKYKGRVIALDPKTSEIKYILSGSIEMMKLGFHSGGVSYCINGTRKQYKGYCFKRISDNENVKVGQIYDRRKTKK